MTILNPTNINQNVRNLEYAVRGPLVTRALELAKELNNGAEKPFKSVIRANIGDCHAMQQKPLTFFRQIISCATYPSMLDNPDIPEDVKERVNSLLDACGGRSVGAYSESCGLEIVRRHCADYIKQRDKLDQDVDWQNIFLTTGASEVVKVTMSLVNQSSNGKPVGVMIPIPQYPLYSATLCELGMHQVNYYLNEQENWSLNVEELERAYGEAEDQCEIKVIVVINPGNPTGAVLSKRNIIEVVEFAQRHNIMILADEVYQHNIWAEGASFTSFRSAMAEINAKLELVSMMSASKGYMGECGLRGGYGELYNFPLDVRAILYKLLSARLCCSVLGQITMSCVVKPPKIGDPSYEKYEAETKQVLSNLKSKAKLVADTFNSIEGMQCNEVAGAMYAFPRLSLPKKAIDEALAKNQQPDFFYAWQLLESTGVCIVPGSGFGQAPNTYHFRTTILPPPDVFQDMMNRMKSFHQQFLARYS
ncbi:Alanine aminotransferase 2 [Fragariocoptes setiger]|uniref:alanine transaminase n=1 Tax=Fragariocoptes setiger TaxID=1670756 RepID=A0ABQ7SD20_9ACAR|nr:Alanine aminotransferase 2 [Fragariocoptes setiger]